VPETGADPNGNNIHGTSLLFHACCRGSLKITRLLLKNGANVDSVHVDGRTPLFAACQKSHASLVELLLSYGADPHFGIGAHLSFSERVTQRYYTRLYQRDMKDYHLKFPIGTTPIMVASASGTPIMNASANGQDDIISQLVKAGAYIEDTNEFGATALLCASAWGHEKEVRALIDAGASLFAVDQKGRSALNHACRGEHVTIVNFLLNRHRIANTGVSLFTERDVQEAWKLLRVGTRHNDIHQDALARLTKESEDDGFYFRPFVDKPVLSTPREPLIFENSASGGAELEAPFYESRNSIINEG
jgi:hypothetical protein